MSKGTRWVALCATIFGLSAEGASAVTLWGGGTQSHSLYKINPITGVRTTVSVFNTATFPGINGLAYNSSDHFLYATRQTPIVDRPNPPSTRIYRIDPTTYSIESFPITGLTLQGGLAIDGLEYDSLRDVFWATIPAASSQLISIDPHTFAATLHGELPPISVISGLAHDRQTDTLYGVEDFGDPAGSRLMTINVDTLELTVVGSPGLGQSLSDLDSLAFDPIDRVLYSINDQGSFSGPSYPQQLVRIDPATGAAELVGPPYGEWEFYQGLAVIVPEPSTELVALLPIIALFGCGTRFSRVH